MYSMQVVIWFIVENWVTIVFLAVCFAEAYLTSKKNTTSGEESTKYQQAETLVRTGEKLAAFGIISFGLIFKTNMVTAVLYSSISVFLGLYLGIKHKGDSRNSIAIRIIDALNATGAVIIIVWLIGHANHAW